MKLSGLQTLTALFAAVLAVLSAQFKLGGYRYFSHQF